MEAREILQNIINDFSTDKFIRFFREKSNKFAPNGETVAQYNDANFKDGKKLGEIKFVEAEQLAVFTFQTSQSLSERSGKKTQYEKGKKILKDWQYDAGIFIFYDANGNFRFSLIYANYLGKKRDWSAFRRFTYFVSKEFTNKTFKQRVGDGDFSSLVKIKDAFSVEKVTKEFYESIANWYFWAVEHCQFPKDAEEEENGRNIAVIRLITRMIFIWFMRERGLVSKNIFEEKNIKEILKDTSAESSSYYKAVLQNLFFATLSTKIKERKFRDEKRFDKGWNKDFGNQNVCRYHDLFKNPEDIRDYFGDIPFLNGGLFECLDDGRNDVYIDGFTERKKSFQPNVPNCLFFSKEKNADLNTAYGTKNKNYKVRGLLDILSSFNFTIDENSPDDQEIALDPELLGRVFENLLASFNPETSTTARKATGSYYTPREIVDYMVAESLKAYFKTHLEDIDSIDEKIGKLFSTGSQENPFNKTQSKKLVDLIESVRIVDPAVGSGAFPMGALNKLVFILNKVDPGNELWKQAQLKAADAIPDSSAKREVKIRIEEFFQGKNADYGRKLYLIQKCIYGVDIQQIAVEIAKLRFFISLLVDEKIDKTKENWGIEPLPNLDFKIMQGNSLLEEYEGVKLFDEKLITGDNFDKQKFIESIKQKQSKLQKEYFDLHAKNKLTKIKQVELSEELEKLDKQLKSLNKQDDKMKEVAGLFDIQNEAKQKREILKRLHKEFFETSEKKTKGKIKEQIEKIGWDLIEATLKEQNKTSELKKLEQFKKSNTKPFFLWKLHFSDVFENGGFDIVIANPPYIKEYTQRSVFDGLRNSPYYQGKIDLWYLFACKNIDFLKNNTGVLAFIAQNNWTTSYGASILRNKILRDTQILNLIDFSDYKIFECAGIQTMVMILQKNTRNESYTFDFRRLIGQDLKFEDVHATLNKYQNGKIEYLKPKITRQEHIDKMLSFNNSRINSILEKIIEKQNFQLDYSQEVAQGIVYPQDRINKASRIKLGRNFNIGDGVFVLNNLEKKQIPFTKKELGFIKPVYTTKELFRWYGNPNNKEWVIYTDSSFRDKRKIEDYPNIKKHLDQFLKVITSDNKPYGLHRAREERFFIGEKIIVARKCVKPTFSLIDFDSYVSATFYLVKTERLNQKYLVALLNSELIAFWLRYKGKMQGNNYQIDKEPLINLPLIKLSELAQKPFIEIVDKILAITKSDDYLQNEAKQKKVKEYEHQIDEMVYKLYGLTEDEIKVIKRN